VKCLHCLIDVWAVTFGTVTFGTLTEWVVQSLKSTNDPDPRIPCATEKRKQDDFCNNTF